MIVLAIDTATPQVGVALAGPGGAMASLAVVEGRRHGEVLAPAITSVCGLAGITLGDVGMLAVDVGPGLFTGLRVGLSTAAALAHALDRPVVGVASTDILAAAHAGAGRPVAAVVDIRRGEVAWALHQGGVEVEAPVVADPAELAAALRERWPDALAVGDGARRYSEVLAAAGIDLGGPGAVHPDPVVLAGVGLARRDLAGRAADLTPRYLRDADVRIGWEQAPTEQPPMTQAELPSPSLPQTPPPTTRAERQTQAQAERPAPGPPAEGSAPAGARGAGGAEAAVRAATRD